MRETLQALVDHAAHRLAGALAARRAGRASRCAALAELGLAPFAPYHWLLYGESLWFDTTQGAAPSSAGSRTHSNASMVIESYEWFLAHRDELADDGTARTTSRRSDSACCGCSNAAVTRRGPVRC